MRQVLPVTEDEVRNTNFLFLVLSVFFLVIRYTKFREIVLQSPPIEQEHGNAQAHC